MTFKHVTKPVKKEMTARCSPFLMMEPMEFVISTALVLVLNLSKHQLMELTFTPSLTSSRIHSNLMQMLLQYVLINKNGLMMHQRFLTVKSSLLWTLVMITPTIGLFSIKMMLAQVMTQPISSLSMQLTQQLLKKNVPNNVKKFMVFNLSSEEMMELIQELVHVLEQHFVLLKFKLVKTQLLGLLEV
jgi:hypothetical protein